MKMAGGKAPTAEENTQAYNELLFSCRDNVTFGIIDEATSKMFPEGDARVAWQNLKDKYEPDTGTAKVQLRLEFQQTSLGEDEDPDEWITKLELIRRRLKNLKVIIGDEEFILHILNNLPPAYESTTELLEDALGSGTLTMLYLKNKLRSKYRRTKKNNDAKMDSVALYNKQQFKGSCTVCGKIGHKGVDCFSLEKNKDKKEAFFKKLKKDKEKKGGKKGQKGDIKCFKCGKTGHVKTDCPDNKEKKKEDDTGMTAVESEVALMASRNGNSNEYDMDTWIGDTGATCHMTNDFEGLFDIKTSDSSVQIGNGNNMSANAVGKYRGTIIQKDGKKMNVVLEDVCYVPDLVCNLFSVTAALSKGWTLSNEGKMMNISQGEKTIKFDQPLDWKET